MSTIVPGGSSVPRPGPHEVVLGQAVTLFYRPARPRTIFEDGYEQGSRRSTEAPQSHQRGEEFDEAAPKASSDGGFLGWYFRLCQSAVDFKERNRLLSSLQASAEYTFFEDGKLLFDWLRTDLASMTEDDRSEFWGTVGATSLARFCYLLERAIDRKYEGTRVLAACRKLLRATAGEHGDARSASLALKRLYVAHHPDHEASRGWSWPSEMQREWHDMVFRAVLLARKVLTKPALTEKIYPQATGAPEATPNKGFFLRAKVGLLG